MILTVTANPTIDRVYIIEDFEIGKVHRAGKVSRSAGGKGINVARVCHILGRETAAMGFVGGYTGEFIKSEVEKQGIKNLFTEISGETRTCVNVSDKSGKSGEILEAGPEVTEAEKEKFIAEFTENIKDYDIICVSGSMPRGLDCGFYKELVRIAKKQDKKIIVDTSGKALEEIINEKPYMVKPNNDELSALMNREIKTDADIKDALFFLWEKGIEVPFISLGKDGAAALVDGVCYKFSTPRVEVVNAVGSGDSAVAGVCAGLDMGYGVIDAIKLGMASGTANTQFEQTGIVTKELVDEYFEKIEVRVI